MAYRYKLKVLIQQSQRDGEKLSMEAVSVTRISDSEREKIAAMLFEAEQYGNTGAARVHISLERTTDRET